MRSHCEINKKVLGVKLQWPLRQQQQLVLKLFYTLNCRYFTLTCALKLTRQMYISLAQRGMYLTICFASKVFQASCIL